MIQGFYLDRIKTNCRFKMAVAIIYLYFQICTLLNHIFLFENLALKMSETVAETKCGDVLPKDTNEIDVNLYYVDY